MPEYKLKARIQNKYKTLAEWNAIAAGEFIPLLGEVCYAVEDGVLLQKIGDGTTDFTKLEWLFCYAPQADYNENDVSSPAYIKNRLGYVDLGNVPDKEQELGHYENPNRSNFETMIFNLVDMVGVGPEALGLGSEWSQIIMCQGDSSYLIDNSSKMASMKDSDDIYTITIGDPGNDYTFEIDTKSYIEIPAEDPSDVPTMVYCIGNPIAINIFLQMEDMGLSFPTDKNINLPYSIMLSVMDNAEAHIVFLGDATQYGAFDPDKIIASIKHTKQSTVYPIDGKFLVNAQADQFEMDTNKTSYIKNRYGDLCTSRIQELDNNDAIFTGTYTIETRKNNNIKLTDGIYTNNLSASELNNLDVIGYDVEINGVLYKNCPLIKTSTMFSKEDSYFIGNPYLINTAFGLENISNLFESKVCHLENNEFPFLLIIKDLNSAKFLDDFIYGTPEWISSLVEDTINIKIGEAIISTVTHTLPSHLFPAELSFTNWVFDKQKNSISAKSAYAATGVNAFAIGAGTKATNANSVAIGADTQATGVRSFAGGYNSVASNQNAFSFGNSVTANANNSTAFGSNTFSVGENQFVIGKYNLLDSNKAFIVGNGVSDVQRKNVLTVDWNGNLQVANSIESQLLILSSPSGKKFQITVDDDGILITKEIIN